MFCDVGTQRISCFLCDCSNNNIRVLLNVFNFSVRQFNYHSNVQSAQYLELCHSLKRLQEWSWFRNMNYWNWIYRFVCKDDWQKKDEKTSQTKLQFFFTIYATERNSVFDLYLPYRWASFQLLELDCLRESMLSRELIARTWKIRTFSEASRNLSYEWNQIPQYN